MFLPVLMVRDFGPWGFVVFAVPNVLGAGALGWTLTRERAAWILRHHGAGVVAFSVVTLSFHLFALGYLLAPLAAMAGLGGWGATGVALSPGVLLGLALLWAGARADRARDIALGAGALLISAVVGVVLLGGVEFPIEAVRGGRSSPGDLMMLAPVVVFGFALCPYLDATFLRARGGEEPGPARVSFGVGFGVMFLAMILLTLLYANALGPLVGTSSASESLGAAGVSATIIAGVLVHLSVQTAFTGFAHVREAGPRIDRTSRPLMISVAVVLVVGAALGVTAGHDRAWLGLRAGEIVYRLYLGFYGLAFPAYVYLCMIPTRDGHAGATRRKLRVWAFAVGAAAPFFWMGFVQFEELLLVPGLLIVLLARLWLPGGPGVGRARGA